MTEHKALFLLFCSASELIIGINTVLFERRFVHWFWLWEWSKALVLQ